MKKRLRKKLITKGSNKVPLNTYWKVDDVDGTISRTSANPLSYSPISKPILTQMNWFEHVLSEENGNVPSDVILEFYLAYMEALKITGYKTVTIDLSNPQIISASSEDA